MSKVDPVMAMLGQTVRDDRSGITGKVIGVVTWIDRASSLVVQPPVRDDRTVPPTTYVASTSAVVVPQMDAIPAFGQQPATRGN